MNAEKRMRLLRIALIAVGATFAFGLYPLMHFFPVSWGWNPPHPEYEQMIQGVYFTLGIFLLWASKDPKRHASLIWFTVWSSAVHGGIMLIQALRDSSEHANLCGDVPALFGVAVVLAFLMPRD